MVCGNSIQEKTEKCDCGGVLPNAPAFQPHSSCARTRLHAGLLALHSYAVQSHIPLRILAAYSRFSHVLRSPLPQFLSRTHRTRACISQTAGGDAASCDEIDACCSTAKDCVLRAGKACSPKHLINGVCCTEACAKEPDTKVCRASTECTREVKCNNGECDQVRMQCRRTAHCPPPVQRPGNTRHFAY